MINPYTIPDDDIPTCINFSGGRSSGYMLYHILDAHQKKLPKNTVVVFANTSKERLETYDFINQVGKEFKIKIHWVEMIYKKDQSPQYQFQETDYKNAKRGGEIFKSLIISKNYYLPSSLKRFCTSDLKITPIRNFIRHHFNYKKDNFRVVLGIRSDEEKRFNKFNNKERTNLNRNDKQEILMPMVYADVIEQDIFNFWNKQSFDLKLKPDESNCDLCFLKGKRKKINIMHNHPELADWWIDMEKMAFNNRSNVPLEYCRFDMNNSYSDLFKRTNQEEIDFNDDEQGISCFCSD